MKPPPPFRIVSLVPSLTETLCYFGLIKNIVGCTSFCVHPKELRHTAVSVGGTKDARIKDILTLNPTHIVTNREENTQEIIRELKCLESEKKFRVVETFLDDAIDNFALISELGAIFNFSSAADQWVNEQQKSFRALQEKMNSSADFCYAYFIWMNPWMVAGNQTYISSVLKIICGLNVFETGADLRERYPSITATDPRLQAADVLFFSSEPFPFKHRHLDDFRAQSALNQPFLKVDGQALSWYGNRFAETLIYLRRLHEEVKKEFD